MSNFNLKHRNTCIPLFIAMFLASGTVAAETAEEAYSRTIMERSVKIVDELKVADKEQAERVQRIIADQYRVLRGIHAERDAEIGAAKETPRSDEIVDQIERESRLAVFDAHYRFVARLRANLTCEQVEQVKDGLTYGVLTHTYNGYLSQLPSLNEDQKRVIHAFLIEARELAMDGGSADEKHGIFRKYKGKINNYLSEAGFKL